MLAQQWKHVFLTYVNKYSKPDPKLENKKNIYMLINNFSVPCSVYSPCSPGFHDYAYQEKNDPSTYSLQLHLEKVKRGLEKD